MDKQPTCACKAAEFTCKAVQMPNNLTWYPVFCKACGAIVGQLPAGSEQDAIKQVGEISTILERLDNIQTLLLNIEEVITTSSN
ncbi:MAG: hypothetical protein FWC21_01490 [Treponema sp.]|nr:hypothetical protein [Treponema sp.]